MNPLISIITPTYKRDSKIIKRCIDSVNGQSFTNWEHLIISDTNYIEDSVVEVISSRSNNKKRNYFWNEKGPYSTWGAYPRQIGMSKTRESSKYLVFLDDDNILLPHHLETMLELIEGKKASICSIYHHGPLNKQHLPGVDAMMENDLVYKLKGTPPELYHIDTLNIMVRKDVMNDCGWVCDTGTDGYCNDGHTYEKLFKEYIGSDWTATNEILAIHL